MVDLAEHITGIIALLGIGYSVAAVGFWHSWRRMEVKIDKVGEALQQIALILCDRVDWDTFDHHQHDERGRMVHGDR